MNYYLLFEYIGDYMYYKYKNYIIKIYKIIKRL